MKTSNQEIRVLYSFPHKLGADRICKIAWHQAEGIFSAGAQLTVFPGAVARGLPPQIPVHPTLARGRLRIPYRLLGRLGACALHDWIVARRLEKLAGQIDIVHTWPLGALQTLRTASRLGIPTVLERCNAHTRFAYQVVRRECERLGVALPSNHEHAWNERILRREEAEYRAAYRLLCPSDFVVKSFLDQGFKPEQLLRHIYGYDPNLFHPAEGNADPNRGLTMISVGVCAVRKGLHYALEAWLQSPASRQGRFVIAGEFLPAYRRKLDPMLAHPSVTVLGHRNDIPDLVRQSDILVLPSIEEGFGLVCTEAMASGCVPLVSEACSDLCRHMENALVHPIADVKALTSHITLLHENRTLLARLRGAGLREAPKISWAAAGVRLLGLYREAVDSYRTQVRLAQASRN